MNHTPGPWTIKQQSGTTYHASLQRLYRVDHVYAHGCNTIREVVAENCELADARLIAAAPDMLEALRALLNDPYLSDPINNDRNAIKKATQS